MRGRLPTVIFSNSLGFHRSCFVILVAFLPVETIHTAKGGVQLQWWFPFPLNSNAGEKVCVDIDCWSCPLSGLTDEFNNEVEMLAIKLSAGVTSWVGFAEVQNWLPTSSHWSFHCCKKAGIRNPAGYYAVLPIWTSELRYLVQIILILKPSYF